MAMIAPDPGFWSKTSYIQLGYGVWINMATLAIGLAHGFPAIQIPQLNHPESIIPVTVEEMSWIASVLSLFNPIGCMLSGFLLDRYGRKPVILVSELPMCLGWIYTGLSNSALHIIIGRAITGIGIGMAMSAPRLYTTEISLANMRGVLGAFPNMFISLGMTIQASMGSFLRWETISLICGVFNACLFLSYCFLGETPHFLVLRGADEQAKKALYRFRARSYDVDAELRELIEFKRDNNIRSLSLKEKLGAICSVSCCRPFGILMTYVAIGVLSGISIVTFWTVELLMISKSSLDAYAGNIAINITRLIFGIIGSILLYHIGRKTIAVMSATGVGISCITLAIIVHYINSPTVLPQIILMIYIAFSSFGFLSLPFLLMSELYPLQVRGVLMGISIGMTSILVFATAKSYPFLKSYLGISKSFYLFGACSFIGAVFLFIFLPETKGLTLQEIEEYFNSRRATLASERQVITAQLKAASASSTIRLKEANLKSRSANMAKIVDKSKEASSNTEPVKLPAKAEKSSLKSPSSHLLATRKSVSFSHPSSPK